MSCGTIQSSVGQAFYVMWHHSELSRAGNLCHVAPFELSRAGVLCHVAPFGAQ